MKNQETLYQFLPRQTRKLIQYQNKIPQPLCPQKEGWANLESSASIYGGIGNDEIFHKYPDPLASKLCRQLGEHHQLDTNQICVGNGSTELVDLILRTFCNPTQDQILSFSPMANRLQHLARLNSLNLEILPLEVDFQLPILNENQLDCTVNKIIYIENPNTIIGSALSQFDIIDVVSQFEGIVVIDESAIDYNPQNSLVSLVNEYPNLIVLQSFSRAWGLAGLRVGVALASAEIIKLLRLVQPPFSVNTIAQQVATKALYIIDKKDRLVEKVIAQREKLKTDLAQLSVVKKVYESESNTLLLKVDNAKELTAYLFEEELIAILDVSHQVGTENCVRITVGLEIDNLRLLNALKNMNYKKSGSRKFLKKITSTLRRASSFLGVFKKIMSV